MNVQAANQQLARDLKVVVRDAEELLNATAHDVGDRVKQVRERLSTALDSARESSARVQDQAMETAQETDRIIREHPYETMGAAFGVGLIIGVLMGRR